MIFIRRIAMKTTKRILAIILALSIALSATACFEIELNTDIDNGAPSTENVSDALDKTEATLPSFSDGDQEDSSSLTQIDTEKQGNEEDTESPSGEQTDGEYSDSTESTSLPSEVTEENGSTDSGENITEADTDADTFSPDELFDGEAIIGSEYFDGTNVAGVNSTVHLFYPEENGSFTLHSISIGGIGVSSASTKNGTYSYDSKTGIYTLNVTGDETLYGKIDGNAMVLCNEDGSDIFYINGREGNGVTDVMIEVRAGNGSYGYLDLAKNKNGKAMQALYRELLNVYEGFYGSDKDLSINDDDRVFATVDHRKLGVSDLEAISVWKIFGLENPAYYYFNNTVSLNDGIMTLYIDKDYAKAENRKRYEEDIEKMVTECSALLGSGMSELNKVMTIHDFVIKKINYAYEDDGSTPQDDCWAHNIIGVSSVGGGVCEAYAKAFDFLCGRFGINALTLSGYAGEAHAWNIVEIGGKWYCVDATWNDTGDDSKLSYDCFGLSYTNMTVSHSYDTPEQLGIAYLYDIPSVSNTDVQLVTLYKDGESLGFRTSIDDAFASMDDKNAEYTVELFNYSYSGPMLLTVPLIKHYIFSEKTPDVKKISLTGTYRVSEGGYISMTPIFFASTKPFLISTDFSIENMEMLILDFITNHGVLIEDAKLTFEGDNCECEVSYIKRTDNDSTSAIIVNSYTTIYSDVDVQEIYTEKGPSYIMLRGNTKADTIALNVICFDAFGGRPHNDVKTITSNGEYTTISLLNAELTVDNIVASNSESVSFSMRFGQLEDVSFVSLTGNVNVPIFVQIDGKIEILSTDMNGNELERWTEQVDPFDIEEPFLRINENIDYESISIAFVEWVGGGGYNSDKTSIYMLDEDGYVCRAELTETEDGFIIKNGTMLIKYSGDAKVPVIPNGITHIAANAFSGCTSIESIVIPEGVISMGRGTFERCSSMTSLSLPSTLQEIQQSSLCFGSYGVECHISFTGTVLDWIRMLYNSPDEPFMPASSTVTCIDGIAPVLMTNDSYYSESLMCMQDLTAEFEGEICPLFIVFSYNTDSYDEGEMFFYYIGDDGFSGTGVSVEEPFTYSNETGIFTARFNGRIFRLKTTDVGFIFCDENGNESTELPQVFFN